MIIPYYTGVHKHGDEQLDPHLSRGGSISSTPIPNDLSEALFPSLPSNHQLTSDRIVRCIALKNVIDKTLENVKIYLSSQQLEVSVEIAIVLPGANECSEPYFEAIQRDDQLPYYASFSKPTKESPITLPKIDGSQYVGVWIKRSTEIDPQSAVDLWDTLLKAYDENTSIAQTEKFSICIEW